MDTRLLPAQALKTAWIGQHLTPLCGQGGAATGHLMLLSHADLKHLRGFLPSRRATQSGQAQRDAIGILHLGVPGVIRGRFSVRKIATKSPSVSRNGYILKNNT